MLAKSDTIDGYAYKPCFSRPDLHCVGSLTLWGFLLHLPAKYRERPKNCLTI